MKAPHQLPFLIGEAQHLIAMQRAVAHVETRLAFASRVLAESLFLFFTTTTTPVFFMPSQTALLRNHLQRAP